MPQGLIGPLATFYFVSVLVIAGLSDLRHREVEPLLWAVALPAAPGLAAYGLYSRGLTLEEAALLAGASLVPAVAAALLYRLCMLGGADAAALAFAGLAGLGLPSWSIIPPGILAVLYSIPAAAALLASEAVLAGCFSRCRASAVEVARSHRRMWLVFPSPASEGCGLAGDPPTLASQGGTGRVAIPLVAALALGGIAAAVLGDGPILSLLLRAAQA